jgi:hypothetical protein
MQAVLYFLYSCLPAPRGKLEDDSTTAAPVHTTSWQRGVHVHHLAKSTSYHGRYA